MTRHDQLALFSSTQRREHVVDWQAPAPVAKVAMGLSGMDAMLGIREGRLPPAPFAKLIGFTMAVVEPGRIVTELEPRPRKYYRPPARRDRCGADRHRQGLRDLDPA